MSGMWATLHVCLPDGEKQEFLGYWSGIQNGHYALSKLVTVEQPEEGMPERVIHDGLWLFNPTNVWLLEQEHEIPLPGPMEP